jgi:hypothetical protein
VIVLLLALLLAFVVDEQRVEASVTTTATMADTTTHDEEQQPHNKHASGTTNSNNNTERRNKMDMGNDFCSGMSMTMAMRGFQSSLFWHGSSSTSSSSGDRHHHYGEEQEDYTTRNNNNNKADCLTFFVQHWKLDTAGQFVGAMVYSFLLAIMTEALTSVQGRIKKYLPNGTIRTVIMSILYAVQQLSGYLVMFIAMTYSMELFASALLGLMAGNLVYLRGSGADEEDEDAEEQDGMVALMGNTPQQRRERAARLLLLQEGAGGGGGSLVGGGCCNNNSTGNMDEPNEEEVALIADRSNAGDFSIGLGGGGAFGTDEIEEHSPLMDALSAASTTKQVDNNSTIPLRRRR